MYLCDPFTHIFQGCFTATGRSHDCPSASEITLKDMGEIGRQQNTPKQ